MDKLFAFLVKFPNGASESDIVHEFPSMQRVDIASNLNVLLSAKKIDVLSQDGVLLYRASEKHSSNDEKIIYNLIKESGAKGMWIRDIKIKTNMAQALVMKVLKNMEHSLIIKAIKSIKSNKKVYILYDQTPGDELTGGVWFNEGEVDEEFVFEMSKVIYTFLLKKNPPGNRMSSIKTLPSLDDIQKFIADSKISTVHLGSGELRILLDTMVADDLIQEINSNGRINYRALRRNG